MEYVWIIFLLIVVILLYPLAIAGLSLAPWVPTRKEDVARVFDCARLTPSDTFVEIGCGNGRVVCAVAKKHHGLCIGIERAWPLYVIARVRASMIPHSQCKVHYADALRYDFSYANVLFVFAMPHSLPAIYRHIQKQCAPGTRILSYTFAIPNVTPTIIDKPTSTSLSLYVYVL